MDRRYYKGTRQRRPKTPTHYCYYKKHGIQCSCGRPFLLKNTS